MVKLSEKRQSAKILNNLNKISGATAANQGLSPDSLLIALC